MKNVGFVLIVILAFITVLSVSCNVEYYDPSNELVEVSFSTGISSKALSRDVETVEKTDLHWFYTAEKKSSVGLTVGQTASEVYIGQGLANRVGPFSQGNWDFTLYGYKTVEGSEESKTGKNLVYKGTVSDVELKKGNQNTVSVSVKFQQSGEGKGLLKISRNVEILSNGAPIKVNANFATIKKADSTEDATGYDIDFFPLDGLELPSGKYLVTLYFAQEVNHKSDAENDPTATMRGIVYAQGAIILNVYDNICTSVEGTITESTTDLGFEAKDDPDLDKDFTVIDDAPQV